MFSIPAALTDEIHPIGRGTVQLLNGENGRGLGSVAGEYFINTTPLFSNQYSTDISEECRLGKWD
jgi:hypothetical protein